MQSTTEAGYFLGNHQTCVLLLYPVLQLHYTIITTLPPWM